jgi:dTDP-glucose 4,6-dehydratase
MKEVLVTGGAGFIGSHFVKLMVNNYPEYHVINLDLLTYAGKMANLSELEGCSNYTFIKGDIRDRKAVDAVFSIFNVDMIVNLAAESHVDRSIAEPEIFLTTNVIGTQVLLDIAKKYWKANPMDNNCREYKADVKFLQVSTDEVYGTLGAMGKFVETSPLLPNSPYSASKAAADLLVRAYYETYGLPMNITRCSNNYGPYQHQEKLIPLMITNCFNNQHLPVYGDGLQVRDWIYVEDHCSALDAVLHRGRTGEVYNIGGNCEKTNMEVVTMIVHLMEREQSLIRHVKDRPGHDRRYAINCSKICEELGWRPNYDFEQGIVKTIQWYESRNTNCKALRDL